MELKIGDTIRNIQTNKRNGGKIGKVVDIEYDNKVHIEYEDGSYGEDKPPYPVYKLIKSFKPNYLLQYELDRDPIELYETLDEVKERILKLVNNNQELKKDTIKVFEIKKEYKVKVKTLLNFVSIK